MTHVRPLAPGGLETLAAVGTAEMPPPRDYGHVVPALTVVLQVLQVLEAACAGGTCVEPARWRGRMSLPHVRVELHLGAEGAAADGASVFRNGVERAARQAVFQFVKILFLVDPFDMFLQEI